ncbi:GRAM domain-containing protein [Halteromyces radiatus]|uniref:GRAM domain-containing protein n=1 Tax=Halteromyces radiatus TaxID=101107 RepID=UPI00221F0D6F|nr:GRAM domain-containing protein [Halteromyces radiatus]KAI8089616.1 GRAM domain-containing protein [Halteromyces radiatus]
MTSQHIDNLSSPIQPPEESFDPNSSSHSLPRIILPSSRRSSFSTVGDNEPRKGLTSQRSQPSLSSSFKSSKKKTNRRRSFESDLALSSSDERLSRPFANDKRNKEFHALFKSVPLDDNLIEDYGCALQKEILLQGRIYISQHHLCFNANIFGWITNLVIAFADIVNIEKRTTAIFIPNAIQISTHQSKHFFASFLSREQAYEHMMIIWQQNQERQSSLTIGNSLKDSNDENDDMDDDLSFTHSENDNQDDSELATTQTMDDLLQEQSETQCQCQTTDDHFPNIVLDQTYQCTIETMYNLLYQSEFVKKYLLDVEKNTDVVIGPWRQDKDIPFVRDVSYVKYLGGAIGPKSTRCILKEELIHLDLHQSVTQQTTTQTPDVPSGNSFCVKTRVCISWAGQGQVRVLVTVLVPFSKSSWLKSTIEKASIDGQINYFKGLDVAIRKYLETRNQVSSSRSKKRHGKRKGGQEKGNDHKQIVNDGIQTIGDLFVIPPTMAQCTMICLILMVMINLYIALKMVNMGQQLYSIRMDTLDSMWQWLEQLEKDPYQPYARLSTNQVMSDQRYYRDPMNRHVIELEKMVRHAGENVDQVHRVVKQQRQELLQKLSS